MSTTSVMSVQEMIERSFGSEESNWVNFKLVQTTLFLLARQLRILERYVTVEVPSDTLKVDSSKISVTEVQLGDKNRKKTDKVAKGKKTAVPDGNMSLGEKSLIHTTQAKATTETKVQHVKKTKHKEENIEKSESSDNLDSQRKLRSKMDTDNSSFRKSLSDTMTDTSVEHKTTHLLKHKVSSSSELTSEEKKKYHNLLEKLEEQREFVLRVIHQRHDSNYERGTSPTPMASMEKTEIEFGKLLIVESGLRENESKHKGTLAILSQQEFKELQVAIQDLQNKFKIESPDFPENMKLMKELRERGASLTDAITALKLSARLEAAEKAIENITEMLTNLTRGSASRDSITTNSKPYSSKSQSPMKYGGNYAMQDEYDTRNVVTQDQLRTCINELTTEIYTRVNNEIEEIAESSRNAKEILRKLERTIQESQGVHKRVEELESVVKSYINRLNALDLGFESQVSIYQEQLTQMQMDLEAGLEQVSEAVANRGGGETELSTELHNYIKNLQDQIDRGIVEQKEVFLFQNELSLNLEHVHQEIELLRDTKADRDEVEDAFRDKAGLEHLNGLVTQEEFVANIKEFEKGLDFIRKRIHEEEIVWQQAIEDLEDKLDQKVDLLVLESLRTSIKNNLQSLKLRISYLAEIVGEPKAAALARKLHRDATCLSCAAPAYMDTEECTLPILPAVRSQSISTEVPVKGTANVGDNVTQSPNAFADDAENKIMPTHDGDRHEICCRKFQISHPMELRTKVCSRFCGGSHTKMSNVDFMKAAIVVSPLKRETKLMTGTDGKVYKIDEIIEEKPCIPCNVKPPEELLPQVEEPEHVDTIEGLLYNADVRSSLQPSSPRASSFLVGKAQKTSIQEFGLQPCQCSKEMSRTINLSIKGVKSEEFEVTDTIISHKNSLTVCGSNEVTETFISHRDSLVCGKASLYEKPKKDCHIAIVSSILKEYIDQVISGNGDTNVIESEGEEETILTTKKNISKTLTIQDDKYQDSVASVSFDLAQLFERDSQNYVESAKFEF